MGDDHKLIFRVGAFTGLDAWLYLLPQAAQARRVAKRSKAFDITIELPSGATYRVVNGVATPAPKENLPL